MNHSLDTLTIRGFKSIQTLDNFPLENINILIGGNGAGKSNLLDFFRMLRKMIDGNLTEFVRSAGGISDLLYNGKKTTGRIEFEMFFGPRGYAFQLVPGPQESFAIVNEARFYEKGFNGWWNLGDSEDGQSRLVKEALGNGNDSIFSKPVYDAISSWRIYHFHDTGSTSGMRNMEVVQENRNLAVDASNIAPYLLRLRESHPETYAEICDAIRMVMPYFNGFILEPERFGEKTKVSLTWRQKGSDQTMQPYHFSDGSIRFACLATALLQPTPPATIIIDEPELGLHPLAIGILAELIHDASNRTQLIVATQSPALIDHFSVQDIIVVNRKDGASTFERLDEGNFTSWLETYSVGELWSKNVISGGPVHE